MFGRAFSRPKEAPYSAFQAMENEYDEDDSHFDVHSSNSSSRMGTVEDTNTGFLQLRVDDSLSEPERVQVFQVSTKEMELDKSSQFPYSSTSKESRQIESFRASDDSQALDDFWSMHSESTISGMPLAFDQVDENNCATRLSMLGANVTSSTNIDQDEKESSFHILPCCLGNRDKSFSRSKEKWSRVVAWFRQLPLVARIGVVMLVVLFVASIVIIIILVGIRGGIQKNNDEQDPSSTGNAEIPATSPTNLSTATPLASFTDSPTSSPTSISTVSPTTTKNLSTATPVASLSDSPISSPILIPTVSPTTTKNLSTATPVASLPDSPTSSPISIPTVSPTMTKSNADSSSPVFDALCTDDTAATFTVNRVTRDCAWLSESVAFQVLLCRPGQGAFETCRETCNNCPT